MLNSLSHLFHQVSSRETGPIDQARIKMLLYCLTSNLIFVSINVVVYFLQGPPLQFARAFVAFLFAIFMLYAVAKWNVWRQIAQLVCVLVTLVIWSNLLLYVQGVNIPTIQFVFLVIVFSFYVQGLKWGIFYSILNVVPIIIYTVFDGRNYFSLSIPPQAISQPAYIFVITYNFAVIIFLHYHFFRTFNRNIVEVTFAKENLRSTNHALESAMTDLERSSTSKMNFLSTMSHELRTPLNGVIGLSNIMLRESPREDQKENLKMLKFSAENLLSLINDILDFNKMEAGKIELENISFDLTDLMKNCAGSLKLYAESKGLELYLDLDEGLKHKLVVGDPTRLTQVLYNLGNNAVKFTEKGYIRLKTTIADLSDTSLIVRFSIEDTGIGIDKMKLKDIFEPFTQASKSTSRKFGGTGLGLSIVKKLMSMFDAEIHLESSPGAGSRFWFEIKYDYLTQQPGEMTKPSARPVNLNGLRVLVAEDNKINVLVVRQILSQWGVETVIAEDGAETIRLLCERSFDIVLMDLHMPQMDGYQAARSIRLLDDRDKANIPIIALTASVSDEVKKEVIDSGMNDYLPKPFNPADLSKKLMKYCRTGVAESSR